MASFSESDAWFLRRVLRLLVRKHYNTILMGRCIMKQPIYRLFSWWFRFTREDTQDVLRMLARVYPGIVLSNRGLKVSTVYLDERNLSSGALTNQSLRPEPAAPSEAALRPRPERAPAL